MGSKVFGTAFDLLDERTGDHQLTSLDVHVNRADFTPVAGGWHRKNNRDTPADALTNDQPWLAAMHIRADRISNETGYLLPGAELGDVHRGRKTNINRQLACLRR